MDKIKIKEDVIKQLNELVKSLIKKMGLEPLFKNINILCSPDVLRQAVPQSGAIITECRLPVCSSSNLWYC